MKRIVAEFMGGRYVNIPGDRLEYEETNNMIFGYNGSNLVAAFDLSGIIKIHICEKNEFTQQ